MLRRILHLLLAVVLGTCAGLVARGTRKAETKPAADLPAAADHQPAPVSTPPAAPAPQPAAAPAAPNEVPPWPTGYATLGRRVIVTMSDGTRRTDRDPELTAVERNSVTLDGRKLFIKPLPPAPAPAQPVPAEAKAEATAGDSAPAVVDSGSSSWVTDRYGVQRLR